MTDAPRWDVRGMAIVFAVSAVVYTLSTCPVVFWGDSAEFATRAATLELSPIARAYPLHRVFSWLAGLLVGSPALGANAVSSLFGAVAVALAHETGRRLSGSRIGGFAAAATLALCPTFWLFAGVAEVYTLHCAILLGLVLAAMSSAESARAAGAFGVLLGLSFLHHRMTVFAMPGLAAYLVVKLGADGLRLRFRPLALGFVAGIAPFVLLCAVASRTPPADTASPALWWFRDVFMGGDQNAVHVLGSGQKSFSTNLVYVVRWIVYDLPGPALVLAAWGFVRVCALGTDGTPGARSPGVRRFRRPEAWLFIAGLPLHLIFPFRYDWTGDQFSFLTPFYALVAPLVAEGVAGVVARWGVRRAVGVAAATAVTPLAVALLLAATPAGPRVLPGLTDEARRLLVLPVRIGTTAPRDFGRANLDRMPRGAILHADWGDGQVYLYLQRVERTREDIDVRIFYGGRPKLERGLREEIVSVMPGMLGTPRVVQRLGDAVEDLGGGLWRVLPERGPK